MNFTYLFDRLTIRYFCVSIPNWICQEFKCHSRTDFFLEATYSEIRVGTTEHEETRRYGFLWLHVS